MSHMVVHTDAPVTLLGTMVSQTEIDLGQTPAKRPDCMYGWGEPQASFATLGKECKAHRLVYSDEEDTTRWIASTLKTLGYQVVVTDLANWSEKIPTMPENYDWNHGH